MLSAASGQAGDVSIARASSIEPGRHHALRTQITIEEPSTSGTNAVTCTPETYLECALTNRSTLLYNVRPAGLLDLAWSVAASYKSLRTEFKIVASLLTFHIALYSIYSTKPGQ